MKQVIVIANRKGGTSKSTLTQVLSQVLTHQGKEVTIIDADPNRPQVRWRKGESTLPITVIGDTDEDNIVASINGIKSGYVLVDLEGVGSLLTSRAIMKANLVLIPLQASALDTAEAGKTVRLVQKEEEILEKTIPYRIILTRTNPAIRSKIEKKIIDDLSELKLPVLKNQLNERSAFKSIFVDRLSLYELDPAKVNGIDKAIQNAETITKEIFEGE